MKYTRLSEITDIFSGFAFSEKELKGDGKPILKIGNILDDGSILFDCDSHFNDFKNRESKLEKYCLKNNDILICMTGYVGNVARSIKVPEKQFLVNQRVGIIRSNGKVDQDFLFYLLRQKYFKRYVENVSSGVAQANISATNIGKFKINYLPDIKTQKAFSQKLRKYDDLVLLNKNQINELEKFCRNLYREWFVKFRFPGAKGNTYSFLNIPKTWSIVKIKDIITFSHGVSYTSDELSESDGINLINLKNINSFGGFRRDGLKKYVGKYKESQIVKYKDLIMGITDMTQERRTVAAVALVPDIIGVISTDLIKIESKINTLFLYCLFRYGHYSKLFSQFGNGSTVIHLRPSTLYNRKLIIPDAQLINKFVKIIEKVIDQIEVLNKENDLLTQQRDALILRFFNKGE